MGNCKTFGVYLKRKGYTSSTKSNIDLYRFQIKQNFMPFPSALTRSCKHLDSNISGITFLMPSRTLTLTPIQTATSILKTSFYFISKSQNVKLGKLSRNVRKPSKKDAR